MEYLCHGFDHANSAYFLFSSIALSFSVRVLKKREETKGEQWDYIGVQTQYRDASVNERRYCMVIRSSHLFILVEKV